MHQSHNHQSYQQEYQAYNPNGPNYQAQYHSAHDPYHQQQQSQHPQQPQHQYPLNQQHIATAAPYNHNAVAAVGSGIFSYGQPVPPYNLNHNPHDFHLSPHHISHLLPEAACFSLHFPLQHSQENVLRVLRLVESECEVLPSKDRTPYLLVAEVIEENYPVNNPLMYTKGREPATSAKILSSSSSNPAARQLLEAAAAHPHREKVLETAGSDEADVVDLGTAKVAHSDVPIPIREVIEKVIDDVRGGSDPYNNYQQLGSSYYPQPPPPQAPSPQQYAYDPQRSLTAYGQQQQYQYPPQDPYMNNPMNHMNALVRTAFARSQSSEEKKRMVQQMSPFGKLPGWNLKSFIVKSGDDLRKEILAMQLIEFAQHVFAMEGIDIFLRPYQICCTGYHAGLIEFIEGGKSIDRIKKSANRTPSTLKEYFEFTFGESYSVFHSKAVENFIKSLVGYSLLTYLLQVKDRHNANLLIDQEGHIIHIDFGFILGDSPGFNINFENAPFKLTKEFVEVMGGIDSYGFKMFEDLFVKGFFAMQKHADGLIAILQLFYGDRKKGVVEALKSR